MKGLFIAIICILATSCVNYPLTTEKDLSELESVWQYLKIYSIWQDNVPQNPFQYDSPEIMLKKMNDTLKGYSYTTYDYYHLCGGNCGISSERTNASSNDTIYWTAVSDSTMYLQITSFEKNTHQNFLSAIVAMNQAHRKYRNLIIDLRRNGGGDIDVTDSIIDDILPDSTPYLIESYRRYDRDNHTVNDIKEETQVAKGGPHWALKDKRYALLVDSLSASASEMLIAAMKEGLSHKNDTDTVVIIGDTTYGKGIGQICITRQYLHRQDLKITFMRMYGLGKIGDYHRKGIIPDIVSENENQQTSLAVKFFEPKGHLSKELSPLKNNTADPNDFPSEVITVGSPDDSLF